MKVVNQSILSAKHLLQTFSEVIEFNDTFDKYFKFSSGEITPFINDNPNFENMDHLAIYINDSDISKYDEFDSDSEYNTYISSGTFYVVDTNTGAIEEIRNINEKEIFISDRAFNLRKKNNGYIYFKDLEDDEKVFEIVILNNELTKPLYALMNTLNKANKDDIDETIDGMCQKFAELLVESSIDASIVAGEIIINRLIRDAVDTYERPDFTKEKLAPYKIYTVLKALEHNRSPIIGLSSQNLKRQLLSDELIEDKIGTSYLDAFYKKRIEL